MGILANSRHERFAQAIAEGRSQTEAHAHAGYRPYQANASKLAARAEVRARVAELVKPAAERTRTTTETLLRTCWDITHKAIADGKLAIASATVERTAKIAGLWVERQTSQNHVVIYAAQPVTAEEWVERFGRDL